MAQPCAPTRRSVGRRLVCQIRQALACLSFILLAAPAASAQSQSWTPVGAPGGNVRSLAADPGDARRIYLGTADGLLYRSDDGGRRWKRLVPGFPRRGCSLDEIAIDERGVLYVGFYAVNGNGGGVARSDDHGRTFTLLKGVDGESVRGLALAPSDANRVAAGTLSGVFLSHDGGDTWRRITPRGHPDLRNVESLAFDPADPNVLYAGTWHLVWKTSNGGAAWAPAHDGMIDDSDVMTLTIGRGRPRAMYATACTGIYRLGESEPRWTKLRGIPYSSRRTRAFAIGRDDADLLLAGTTEGLWVSEDAGGSWWRMTPKDLVVNAVVSQPGGDVLLGTEGAGVLRSSDRGKNWVTSNTGFSDRFVFKMHFDPDGRRLAVAVWGPPQYGGVFVSPGVGGPWKRLVEGMEGRQVLSLAHRKGALLAGTDDGVYELARDATAWSRLGAEDSGGGARPRVTELIVLPRDHLVGATSRGIIRSVDGGRTWTHPALGKGGQIFGLARNPEDPEHLVASTQSGFYASRDGGASWERVGPALKGVTPHEVAFMPTSGRILFATTTGGLYRSEDQGATWGQVGGGIPHSDLTGIAFHPDGRTIYVSDFTWGGVFRSRDRGSSWGRMGTEGLGSDRVWALGVDPSAPERLLASASAGGLHVLVTAGSESRGREASSGMPTDLAPASSEPGAP